MSEDPGSTTLEIAVVARDPLWRAAEPHIEGLARRAAEAVFSYQGFSQSLEVSAEASIVLADDALVRDLNKTYRHQDRPTNVLAFGTDEIPAGRGGPRLLGDVVLARETVLREAEEQGKSLADHARSYLPEVDGKLADPVFRDEIAQLELDARAFALTVQRSADGAKAGHKPGPESSLFKVYGTELNMRRQELMVRIAGPQALGWEGDGFEEDELALTRDWLRSRGNALEGGSSEIQRNIIAKRVLGLPD